MTALHALLFDAFDGEGDNARPFRRDLRGADEKNDLVQVQDAELVARVRAGDRVAFETLYRMHVHMLVAVANTFVHAPDVAEELVGDVFVRLWEVRAEFTPAAGTRAYLCAAVRHRALNHIRTTRREDARHRTLVIEGAVTAPNDGEHRIERAELLAQVRHMVDAFPEIRRQVVQLRWGAGLDNGEIAAALGLTDQAVRSHVSRALRDLRQAFSDLIE